MTPSHARPAGRKAVREALTGVLAGGVLRSEISQSRTPSWSDCRKLLLMRTRCRVRLRQS